MSSNGIGALPESLADALAQSLHHRARDPGAPERADGPDELVRWLAETIPSLVDAAAPPTDERDQWIERAATLAVALVYGPDDKGPPPGDVLDDLAAAARFGEGLNERAIERALVFGVLLPPGGGGWPNQWPGALSVLLIWVRDLITRTLQWYRKRILRGSPLAHLGDNWVESERWICARDLVQGLVGGCDCWRHAPNLSVNDEARAVCRCHDEHTLSAWNGEEPLNQFLWRAILNGHVNLAYQRANGSLQPERAQINSHRYGMLPKMAVEGQLRSGSVMRCPDCDGEIDPQTDRCSVCDDISRVTDPPYWLWLPGQRVECPCHKCMSCPALYFHRRPTCLGQKSGDDIHRWSQRSSSVWVRAHAIEVNEALDPAPSHGPDHPVIDADQRRVWQDRIELLLNEPVKDLARELLLEGMDVGRLPYDPLDKDFLNLLLEVVREVVRPDTSDIEARLARHASMLPLGRELLLNGSSLEAAAGEHGLTVNVVRFRNAVLGILLEVLRSARGVEAREENEPGLAGPDEEVMS